MATQTFEVDEAGRPVRPVPQDHLPKANPSGPTPPDGWTAKKSLVEITRPDGPGLDRIPVFSIDGEIYTIPGQVPMSIALQALEDMATMGEIPAMAKSVRLVLGEKAYQALKGCEYLTQDQLKAVFDLVGDHIQGAMEAATKN